MPQRYVVTKSIIRTMPLLRSCLLRPCSFNHDVRHFQSKTAFTGILSSTPISPLHRRPAYLFSNSYKSKNVKDSFRNFSRYTKPEKFKRASTEIDDDESTDDDVGYEKQTSSDLPDDSGDESQVSDIPMAFTGVNSFSKRSHTCGELNLNHVGQEVSLYGWIESKRGDNFIILRDVYGCVQICLADYTGKEVTAPPESVIHVIGTVIKRSSDHVNKEMPTGEIEVCPTVITTVNTVSKRLPFSLKGYNKPKESLRLKHRYLHFRFPEMQHTLRVRSNVLHKMRRYLVEECSFVEVETPTLFGKTPGGAQEFVVPTKHKGKCYALVQSPQQFKQMLMVGGLDRYFQIARCYRDEDSRSDRQPEFTQLDLELSFADMNGVINLTEQILKHSWPEDQCDVGPLTVPFPRMRYKQAVNDYGTDKPDLRYHLKINDFTNSLTAFFQHRDKNNVRLLTYANKGSLYSEDLQKEMDKIIAVHQSESHPALLKIFPYKNLDSFYENLKPALEERVIQRLFSLIDTTQPGDLLVFGYGDEETVLKLLGALRVPIAKFCGIPPSCRIAPLWVTHFPLLEKGTLIGQFKPVHHPFTNITKNSVRYFLGSPLWMESLSYDLVINGQEIGGGSERIKDVDFQVKILKKIGADPKDFAYFLNALSYGCPPHAGIALGIDRFLACLLDAESIRDVIAFPKSFDGVEPLSGSPFTPSSADKARYRLK